MRSESEMIESMKQALKYAKQGALVPVDVHTTKLLVDALRAALAEDAMQRLTDVQQEMEVTSQESRQVEPVAYVTGYSKGYATVRPIDPCLLMPVGMALYRSPPKRSPLTDEEVKRIKPVLVDFVSFRSGVRCAERAHGIGDVG